MKNCKCKDTITKKQVDYLGRLAELTVEAALGGKNSLSYDWRNVSAERIKYSIIF